MDALHTREYGPNVRAVWVPDPDYQTRGSYALDTPEETEAAEREEIEALESGRFVALGCIVQTRCNGCGEWREHDSLWGIVIAPDPSELDAYADHSLDIPTDSRGDAC